MYSPIFHLWFSQTELLNLFIWVISTSPIFLILATKRGSCAHFHGHFGAHSCSFWCHFLTTGTPHHCFIVNCESLCKVLGSGKRNNNKRGCRVPQQEQRKYVELPCVEVLLLVQMPVDMEGKKKQRKKIVWINPVTLTT